MTYAIIGSGAIGSALARQFARSKIDVLVANSRGPETIHGLVEEYKPYVKATTLSQALLADLVILAVPFSAVPEAVRSVTDWSNRIVVDATNAIDFPSFKPKDLGGQPSTMIVAQAVSGARVVKAFNTLPAALLATDPTQDGGRRLLFISGNDAGANDEVGRLVQTLGFSSIRLGSLAEGGLLQQFGGPLVAKNLTEHD
jgi:predicted dinucleotide-binding enzyme